MLQMLPCVHLVGVYPRVRVLLLVFGHLFHAAKCPSRRGERGLLVLETRHPRNLCGVALRVFKSLHALRARGHRCYAVKGA